MPMACPELRCCDCGHTLTHVAQDDEQVTVTCPACGAFYGVEKVIDADGSVTYWPQFHISLKGDHP